jgi:glycosyltransferase involved in cell wall biosynthesis
MIKVCSPQLGLSLESQLGGEVHDSNLVLQMAKKGIKFSVLLPRHKSYPKHKNIVVQNLMMSHIFPPHVFNILSLGFVIQKYQNQSIDILRIHTPYFLGFTALLVKKLFSNSKIVTTIHLKEERIDLLLILNSTIKSYDHIFTVSNYLKKWLVTSYKIAPNKITVISNGVENFLKPGPKDSQLVKKYKLKDKVVLLNVGLLNDRKNVLFLIDVFKELIPKYKNLVLIICGSGNLKIKLEEIIEKSNLIGKVYLFEPVYGQQKLKVFNLADIFLFPSKNEGFGLVGAEAMACGKPVIAADNSSLPELVDDKKSGYLAKTNDINDWVHKIELLINSNKLKDRMGKNGLKKVKKYYTWDKVADKTIEVYQRLTS